MIFISRNQLSFVTGFMGARSYRVRAFFYSLIHGAIIQRSMGSNIDQYSDYEVSL